ncbi:hypothetical protein AXF42_Ash020516 [Apostasia shenzhenica]|uniref:Uncharacterized protein n=1 Tax=Apostasia shenzhenica TaxID=1088818 RepID=A0A2H9ZXZ4_9ASPA|nr:hypothetical protein AXF42_Ash020516 [Apostasia shenzhenica]
MSPGRVSFFGAFGTPGIASCGRSHWNYGSSEPRIAIERMLDLEIWTALAVFLTVSSCYLRDGHRCLALHLSSHE